MLSAFVAEAFVAEAFVGTGSRGTARATTVVSKVTFRARRPDP